MVLCVRVPKRDGESARLALSEAGALDRSFRIRAEGDSLLIPALHPVDGYAVEDADLEPIETRTGDYRLLADVPEELRGMLPSSFDVVGDVGIIKLPDALLPHSAAIGGAMMEANRSLRCVFLDTGVAGELRVRGLSPIAGEGPSETVHREFGSRIRTDPGKVYFNPRLAGERRRVASLVEDGETVIDMFSGVAPFGLLICRLAKPEAVYSIDLNPDAVRFAEINKRMNKADALMPIEGDAREVVPTLPAADRVIMNLPHVADEFLPLAMSRLKEGGTVHLYKISERDALPGLLSRIEGETAASGRPVDIRCSELKTYSPTMSVYSLDVTDARTGSSPVRARRPGRWPACTRTSSRCRRTSSPCA